MTESQERQHTPTTPFEVRAAEATEARIAQQTCVEKAREHLKRQLDALEACEETERHYLEMCNR